MKIIPMKDYTPPYPGKPSGGTKNSARSASANGKGAAIRAAAVLAATLAVAGGAACNRPLIMGGVPPIVTSEPLALDGDVQFFGDEAPISTPDPMIDGYIGAEDVCTPEPTEDAIWMGVAKIEDTVKFPFMP